MASVKKSLQNHRLQIGIPIGAKARRQPSSSSWPGGIFEERFQIPLKIHPLSSVEGPHPRGMMALVLRDTPSPQEGDTEAQNTHVILRAPVLPI